ncbi:MFS transporter [Priestia megaterium]|uniref:MFS transporter n=1 Tax=Priestia megaterium TaxID=1404 RepID=UPI00339AA8E3
MGSSNTHVIQSRQDIINFVNSNPVTSKSWKIILVALGGIFVDAYDFTSLGIGADQLKEQFNLSPAGLGSLTAIMALGALLGATVGGYYTDKFGRNKMFLIDLFFMVFSALGAALATDLVWLFIFRFLMGVGVGLDVPVALSFIAEFSNLKKKGQYVNLWCPLWYVAATVTGLVVLPFYLLGQHEDIWRWSVGFGAVAALIVLILRYRYMDESPMWAAHHLPLKEAVKVLEKTYDIQVTMAKNAKEKPLSRSKKLSYKAIFQGKYRARTFLASIITATQSMQYFAVGFYIPTISTLIFGKGMIYAIIGTLFFNLFGIIGGFTQSRLTEQVGIRKLAITGYTICSLSLVLMGLTGDTHFIALPILFIALFIFGQSFGPGAQGMTMATLSYPTELRGLGSGWGQGTTRIGSILGFYLFPVVLSIGGIYTTFLVLTIVPVIGLIATILIKWEPIGTDVEKEEEQGFESNKSFSKKSEVYH